MDYTRRRAEKERTETVKAHAALEANHKIATSLLEHVQTELKESKELVQVLANHISDLSEEAMKAKTKDALIESLQRRVQNISAEYNGKCFGRRAVTLEDVFKITGELENDN